MKSRTLFGRILDQVMLLLLGGILAYAYFYQTLAHPVWAAACALGLLLAIHMAARTARAWYRRRHEKDTRRREQALQAVTSLLYMTREGANAQAAQWICQTSPLSFAGEYHEYTRLFKEDGAQSLFKLCIQHPLDGKLGATIAAGAWRDARLIGAEHVILATNAQFSREAEEYARGLTGPGVRLISGQELAEIAFRSHSAIAPAPTPPKVRRRIRLEGLTQRANAKRYLVYGAVLLILYLLIGIWVYLLAALSLLTLAGLCLRRKAPKPVLPR